MRLWQNRGEIKITDGKAERHHTREKRRLGESTLDTLQPLQRSGLTATFTGRRSLQPRKETAIYTTLREVAGIQIEVVGR